MLQMMPIFLQFSFQQLLVLLLVPLSFLPLWDFSFYHDAYPYHDLNDDFDRDPYKSKNIIKEIRIYYVNGSDFLGFPRQFIHFG